MPNPVGPPGNWNLVMNADFTLGSMPAGWRVPVGGSINSVTISAADVSFTGGYCNLTLSSTSAGGAVTTGVQVAGFQGSGSPGPLLNIGDCCEAYINFPGPTSTTFYNFPAWWTSGLNWPNNGELDIIECYDPSPVSSYHGLGNTGLGSQGSGNNPGSWANSFHTYTVVRGATTAQFYWDGNLVWNITTHDDGGPMNLIANVGWSTTNQANRVFGATSAVKIQYARLWSPGTSAPGLSITTTSLPSGITGTAYSTALTASGGTGSGQTWSISSGSLPAGLSISSAGVISGTPTTAGTASFTVSVTDSGSNTTTRALSITIAPANVPTPGLPSWATLNTATGVITGTPNATGTTSFNVTVTDSAGITQTLPMSITVAGPLALVVLTTSLPAAVSGSAYVQTLAVAGGTPPYTWTLASGSLPSWATLAGATGTISGTPSAVASAIQFTVQVTDSKGNAASQALSIAVISTPVVTGIVFQGPAVAAVATGAPTSVSAFRVLDLQAGDTVTPTVYQNSGASLTLTAGNPGYQSRFGVVYLCPYASGGNTSFTPPQTQFHWAAGTPGGSLLAYLNQHLGNDLNFLVNRPYFTGYQTVAQTGLVNGTWNAVTITPGGILHGSAGDNYGGWNGPSGYYAAQQPGWYLVLSEVYAALPTALTGFVAAGIKCGSSGGVSPSTSPDQYQTMFFPQDSAGTPVPGAAAIGMYYLNTGEYVQPMIRCTNWGGNYSTYVSSSPMVNSQFTVIWMAE